MEHDDASQRYRFRFDFDAEDEPPRVYITDEEETPFGSDVIQVFEDAECTNGAFSWNPKDWKAGPLTTHLLMLLNANPEPPVEKHQQMR